EHDATTQRPWRYPCTLPPPTYQKSFSQLTVNKPLAENSLTLTAMGLEGGQPNGPTSPQRRTSSSQPARHFLEIARGVRARMGPAIRLAVAGVEERRRNWCA